MFRCKLVPMLGLLVLTACTTMTPEERRAADEAKCRSYGFKTRNDAFAECLQRIDLDRRAQRRADDIVFSRYDPWYYRGGFYYVRPVPQKAR